MTKCNSGKWWNNDKRLCECKKRHVFDKDYIWNPATCTCQNGKYLVLWIIICDEIIDADEEAKSNDEDTKTFTTTFNEKNITYKTKNFYILLTISLISIALWTAVSIYCYLIKYREKSKTFITISQHK